MIICNCLAILASVNSGKSEKACTDKHLAVSNVEAKHLSDCQS